MQSLNFEEILPGSSVRVTNDGMIYAVDLVMVISGKNNNDAGKDLRCLAEETFSSAKIAERKTGGKGNTRTKLVSFNDSIELIMVLPGKMAKEMRTKFADVIRRYLAGDPSLVAEVLANAISTQPVSVMARASLESEPAPPVDRKLETRKKQLELEDMELELRVKRAKVEAMELANRKAELAYVVDVKQTLTSIKADNTIDSGTRYAMEYAVKRVFIKDSQVPSLTPPTDAPTAIENAAAPTAAGVISISGVAIDLGFAKPDSRTAMAIGATLAALYRNQYGTPPQTAVRLAFDGVVCPVKIYTERDRDLVEQAVRKHMG